MEFYNAVPPPPDESYDQPSPQPRTRTTTPRRRTPGIDIDAWTISALQSLSVSPVARGTGSPLAIPIDDEQPAPRIVAFKAEDEEAIGTIIKRPTSARDSMKRRDALLKGKDGSRQRRRWENDRLMGVPNVQPPLPSDWEVHATHPIQHTPYKLARFWERGVREQLEDRTAQLLAQRKAQQLQKGSATGLGMGEVPRDLRETSKRSPTVRSWIKDLEEPIRRYLDMQRGASDDVSEEDEMDSEDEEIVFVGRKAAREKIGDWKMAHREDEGRVVDEGIVFESFGVDESAAFKRWLTHSISDYYGLESRSVSLDNPSRRVVYVGLKQFGRNAAAAGAQLPRPLWEICRS